MFRHLISLFSVSVLMASACGPEATDIPPTSSSQETVDGAIMYREPVVIVLVVDDAPTPEAAALRTKVAGSVRSGLLSEIDERWGSCGSPDPAAWHPGDMRVVVVRPSAPDDEAWVTPLESPSLAWITKNSTKEEVESVTAGVGEALGARVAQPGELFRPLRAAKRAVELVTGARAPATDSEAKLVASLPKKRLTRFVVAATRDDEDSTAVEDLALDEAAARAGLMISSVVGPWSGMPDTCSDASGSSGARLEAWGTQESATLTTLPCEQDAIWDNLLSFCCADCAPVCRDRPLTVSPEGAAACRIYIDQATLEGCDPERGYQDPEGKATFVDRFGQKLRRCELVQLSGASLSACRSSLECAGCPSGFCVTEVPELSHAGICPAGQCVWPFRVVGGALDAPGGYIQVVCTTKSP